VVGFLAQDQRQVVERDNRMQLLAQAMEQFTHRPVCGEALRRTQQCIVARESWRFGIAWFGHGLGDGAFMVQAPD
jgi:hypothetical protein